MECAACLTLIAVLQINSRRQNAPKYSVRLWFIRGLCRQQSRMTPDGKADKNEDYELRRMGLRAVSGPQ